MSIGMARESNDCGHLTGLARDGHAALAMTKEGEFK